MSIWQKLFGRGQRTLPREVFEVTCPKCSRRYRIGEDAAIIGLRDAMRRLGASGMNVMVTDTDVDSHPYLVATLGRDASQSQDEALAVASRVRQSIRTGSGLKWICAACNNRDAPHNFPREF